MKRSSTQSSHPLTGCFFLMAFIVVALMCCMLSIVTFIICLIDTGDVLGSISSAGVCGFCTLLIGMGLALVMYLIGKFLKAKADKDEKKVRPMDGRGEYVEFEEIIEGD